MRAPLTVRINDGTLDRHVTQHVEGLRFRKTAPGGNHSASMTLRIPRDTFPNLGPADSVYIHDARSGATVWDGYTDNPGKTDGPAGEGFDLSAMGGTVLASDESQALIYVAFSFDGWERAEDVASAASASTEVSTRPTDGQPALLCQFNPGQPISSAPRAYARMSYPTLVENGLKLGGIELGVKGGKIDANYIAGIDVTNDAGVISAVTAGSATLTTTTTFYAKFAPTDFTTDAVKVSAQIYKNAGGATTVADDNTWAAFTSMRIAMRRVDRDGAEVTLTVASAVFAHEVVEDLLGRLLTFCDPDTAVVDTTTFAIGHLAYAEGATSAKVLDDLSLYEPDFYWGIGERGLKGLHRFWYRAWPTDVRYEISVKDDYSAPGGEADLCNRIAVYWNDSKGNKQTTIRTSTVEALGSRIRDAEPVTLPDGQGSTTADAETIGDQVLASKAEPPKAATATVRRLLLDHDTGNLVMPWELEPGCLVRVRETGDVLRMTEMEYVDDDCAATLTLGEPVLTTDQRIARLGKQR